jgi:hypothetical protein
MGVGCGWWVVLIALEPGEWDPGRGGCGRGEGRSQGASSGVNPESPTHAARVTRNPIRFPTLLARADACVLAAEFPARAHSPIPRTSPLGTLLDPAHCSAPRPPIHPFILPSFHPSILPSIHRGRTDTATRLPLPPVTRMAPSPQRDSVGPVHYWPLSHILPTFSPQPVPPPICCSPLLHHLADNLSLSPPPGPTPPDDGDLGQRAPHRSPEPGAALRRAWTGPSKLLRGIVDAGTRGRQGKCPKSVEGTVPYETRPKARWKFRMFKPSTLV